MTGNKNEPKDSSSRRRLRRDDGPWSRFGFCALPGQQAGPMLFFRECRKTKPCSRLRGNDKITLVILSQTGRAFAGMMNSLGSFMSISGCALTHILTILIFYKIYLTNCFLDTILYLIKGNLDSLLHSLSSSPLDSRRARRVHTVSRVYRM